MFLFNMALHYKQFWMRLGFSTYAASPLCNKIFFSKTQVCVRALKTGVLMHVGSVYAGMYPCRKETQS
jgi:hypothetical protein